MFKLLDLPSYKNSLLSFVQLSYIVIKIDESNKSLDTVTELNMFHMLKGPPD